MRATRRGGVIEESKSGGPRARNRGQLMAQTMPKVDCRVLHGTAKNLYRREIELRGGVAVECKFFETRNFPPKIGANV